LLQPEKQITHRRIIGSMEYGQKAKSTPQLPKSVKSERDAEQKAAENFRGFVRK
jgi:hypothetical protein